MGNITDNDCENLAGMKGWTFRGPSPRRMSDQTWWFCDQGHMVQASATQVLRGEKCKDCNKPFLMRILELIWR